MTLRNTPDGSEHDDIEQEIMEEVYVDEIDDEIILEDQQANGENDDFHADNNSDLSDTDMANEVDAPEVAQLVLRGHTQAVFTICTNKDGTLAVSGGEDDKAVIWNLSDGKVIQECTGFTDSVTCASFNKDGSLLALGDMLGVVQVWACSTSSASNFSCIWTSSDSVKELQWLHWHFAINCLMAGSGDETGCIWVWKIKPSDRSSSSSGNMECKSLYGPGSACLLGQLLSDGTRLLAAYENAHVCVWDLKTEVMLHNITLLQTVKSQQQKGTGDGDLDEVPLVPTVMTCRTGGGVPIAAVGSTLGKVFLIHCDNGKILDTIYDNNFKSEEGAAEISVEAIAFSNTHPYLAFGTNSGHIYIYDHSCQQLRQSWRLEDGVSRIIWSSKEPVFYTAGLHGMVQCWDGLTGTVKSQWQSGRRQLLDLVLTNHKGQSGGRIISASEDCCVRVFDLL